MDTPLHALAVPDADRSTLKRPEAAAREIADLIAGAALGRPRQSRAGERGGPVIAASVPFSGPPDARLLVIDETGRSRTVRAPTFPTLVRARRPRGGQRRRDAAGEPRRHPCADRRAPIEVRLAGRDSLLPARRDPFHRRRVRRRRLSDADRAPAAAARPARRRRAAAGSAAARPCCAVLGASAPGRAALRESGRRRSGKAWPATAGRFSTRYVPEPLAIWDTWTRSPACRWRSSRRRRDSSSTGPLIARSARAARRSPRLTHAAGISSTGDAELDRLLPLDEPYDIPPSTAALIEACRRRGGRVDRHRHDRRAGARARGARRRHGSARAQGSRRSASVRSRRSASSMPSCRACTNPAPATTSCCGRFRTTTCCGGWSARRSPRIPDARVRRLGVSRAQPPRAASRTTRDGQ